MTSNNNHKSTRRPEEAHAQEDLTTTVVAIAGGGIVGLTLALALRRKLLKSDDKVRIDIYEKAADTATAAGAGMSMYPNGLRVLRDIDAALLVDVQGVGVPYQTRAWTASHTVGGTTTNTRARPNNNDHNLQPMGLCRCELQRLLQQRVLADPAIYLHHQASVVGVDEVPDQTTPQQRAVRIHLVDGQVRHADVLFGCDGDGAKSAVRRLLVGQELAEQNPLQYTGVTCLMGLAPASALPAHMQHGITQVSSQSTPPDLSSSHNGTHAVFFPTRPDQICFQFHVPTAAAAAVGQSESNGQSPGMSSFGRHAATTRVAPSLSAASAARPRPRSSDWIHAIGTTCALVHLGTRRVARRCRSSTHALYWTRRATRTGRCRGLYFLIGTLLWT